VVGRRRAPQRTSVACGTRPAARINAAHSGPCGRDALPNRFHTTTWAASWPRISWSADIPRDVAATPISIVSPGGSHRATVDLSRGLTTGRSWEMRGYFQILANNDKCFRPARATWLAWAAVSVVARRGPLSERTGWRPILARSNVLRTKRSWIDETTNPTMNLASLPRYPRHSGAQFLEPIQHDHDARPRPLTGSLVSRKRPRSGSHRGTEPSSIRGCRCAVP